MYLTRDRKKTSRLLLGFYLLILAVTSLHLHPEGLSFPMACDQCTQHLPHGGHLYGDTLTLHDCLLCQLATTPLLAASATCILLFRPLQTILPVPARQSLHTTCHSTQNGRAPPCLF